MNDVGIRAVAFFFRPAVGLTFALLLLAALTIGAFLNLIVEACDEARGSVEPS